MNYLTEIPRTAMEVYNMLPEGTLCEVIDNTIYMSPSPTTNHQRILGDIFAEIKFYLRSQKAGEVFVSPYDIYLDDEQTVVQPDIVFIGIEKSDLIQKKGICGSPDLVIEILSTNIYHDKKRKLDLYERNSIPEYIIIDPDTKEVSHYVIHGDKYQQIVSQPGQISIRQLSLEIVL